MKYYYISIKTFEEVRAESEDQARALIQLRYPGAEIVSVRYSHNDEDEVRWALDIERDEQRLRNDCAG